MEDDHREIKSPLRGFKWLNRPCAALNRASRGSGGHVGKRGGTRSVASWERGCYAYAVLAKTDVATTPGIPGYATIGLCQNVWRLSATWATIDCGVGPAGAVVATSMVARFCELRSNLRLTEV